MTRWVLRSVRSSGFTPSRIRALGSARAPNQGAQGQHRCVSGATVITSSRLLSSPCLAIISAMRNPLTQVGAAALKLERLMPGGC